MMLVICRTIICLWIIIPMVFLFDTVPPCPPRNRWSKTVPEPEFWALAGVCGYREVKHRDIQFQGEWSCYAYTAEELSWLTKYKHLEYLEKEVCEYPKSNRKFTKGQNDKTPGCNNCWCCQRTKVWKCYTYTRAEIRIIEYYRYVSEKMVCEINGKFFSEGNDKLVPGCGKCRCCQKA